MPLTSAMLVTSGAEKQCRWMSKPLLDRAEQVLVPLDLQIGMQAALHQHAGAAQVERLLNLVEDRFLRQDVAFGVPHRAVERAEAAILGAEVGVVDVAVDDVGDHAFRVQRRAPRRPPCRCRSGRRLQKDPALRSASSFSYQISARSRCFDHQPNQADP